VRGRVARAYVNVLAGTFVPVDMENVSEDWPSVPDEMGYRAHFFF